jgi:hypothetical protein
MCRSAYVDIGPEVLDVRLRRLLGLGNSEVNLLLGGLVDSLGVNIRLADR